MNDDPAILGGNSRCAYPKHRQKTFRVCGIPYEVSPPCCVYCRGNMFLFYLALRDLGVQELPDLDIQDPSIFIFRLLERLPIMPELYYCITALVGIYLRWRWYSYANFFAEFDKRQNDNKCSLTSRDWWVVREFRKRAFVLRTRADWVLGSIFLLLAIGIYFTIFILPRIEGADMTITKQQQYKDGIDGIIDSLFRGQYWIEVPSSSEIRREDMDNRKTDASSSHDISVIKVEHERGNSTLELGVPLGRGEWIIAAAFSENGRVGVVAGDEGSLFRTTDSGESWRPEELSLERRERITAAAFSADGRVGAVAGIGGSVFLTTDSGESWRPEELSLGRGEWIIAAAFSENGRVGVVAGDEGSLFRTTDSGESWRPEELSLERRERITAAAFSADGRVGAVAGIGGSVFLTTDSGESWRPEELSLGRGEWIIAAAFSADGRVGVVASDEGSLFRTTDGGERWESLELPLERRERITAAAFGADGRVGVVAGDEGSVFRTTDGGKRWESLDLPLEKRGGIIAMAFETNTQTMIYYITSAVDLKIAAGNWKSFDVSIGWRERITAAAFSADGRVGIVAGDEGSVFLTTDGGEIWRPADLPLERGEWITAAAFSADGRVGVVAGVGGSVFRMTDDGKNWGATEFEDSISPVEVFVLTKEGGGFPDFVLEADNGVQYLLRNHKKLENWRNKSLLEIYNVMKDDDILGNTGVVRETAKFLVELRDGGRPVDTENSEDDRGFILDDLTAMRTVTLVSLLILMHVLIRLHRYSVRLAAFWDSRADAVLLAQSFARCNAETFDDLAAVFAPDAYDFKPAARLGHEAATNLVDRFMRRESRKS